LLATIVVTSVEDTIAADGAVTLREALIAANENAVSGDATAGDPGLDIIEFAIPGAGVRTIAPTAALPTITEPVTIDGYSQPLSAENSQAFGTDAVLLIELNGAGAGGTSSGLVLGAGADGSTIQGLAINRFQADGITIVSGSNVIQGNYIGTDAGGTADLGNLLTGIRVASGAGNRIGGTTPQDRNVISGNGSGQGGGNVALLALTAPADPEPTEPTRTIIRGNHIGTNAAGTASVQASAAGSAPGIYLAFGDTTVIGGADADDGALDGEVGARNVISGNSVGVFLAMSEEAAIDGATIQGNLIGVDATGGAPLGNFGVGIQSTGSPEFELNDLVIGGTADGAGNVISGNADDGIQLVADNPIIQGNRIGTDVEGLLDLGNGGDGVELNFTAEAPQSAGIGGTSAAAGNIISGNALAGVRINTTAGQPVAITVQGNRIGTQADGQTALGNGQAGVAAAAASTIGGTAAGAGNVIAFNGTHGVIVDDPSGPSVTGVAILGNSIFANGPSTAGSIAGLGIALGEGGPVANDLGDADSGDNGLQNFPVPTFISATSGNTMITGTLNSTGNGAFRIEFFASDAADPSGFGEGRTFLGATTTTTDAEGNASFLAGLPALPVGQSLLTMTATNLTGGTSGFSVPFSVPTPTDADLALSVDDALETVTAGTNQTYILTLMNNGPAAAASPTLTTAIPAATTFVSFTAPAGWTANTPDAGGTGAISATAATLAAGGAGAVFTLVVRVDPLAPGGTPISLTAQAGPIAGDPVPPNNSDTESSTVAAAPPGGDTTGPVLTGLQRFGFHGQKARLVLSFSEGLAATGAASLANYQLVTAGRDGRFGSRDDRAIALASASHEATTNTVTLTTRRPLPLGRPYQLRVSGGPGGLTDLAGNPLDGDGDGLPGGDALFRFDRSALVRASGTARSVRRLAGAAVDAVLARRAIEPTVKHAGREWLRRL
jgi:uncharacterized repeat protein (TIGR01451 family)